MVLVLYETAPVQQILDIYQEINALKHDLSILLILNKTKSQFSIIMLHCNIIA